MSARRLRLRGPSARLGTGFTLLEVLITLIVLAVGMLGIASLQGKSQLAQVESYQRAQAILLLEDMVSRINANRANAATYVTGLGSPLGTGDGQPATCAGAPGMAQDRCEWSNQLKGAAECADNNGDGDCSDAGETNVGAMIGARGCIELVQAADPTSGVCRPGIYRVTVVWQGLNPTSMPPNQCAVNLYGDDRMRRAISATTVIALNSCN